jgi:hypothetical protein
MKHFDEITELYLTVLDIFGVSFEQFKSRKPPYTDYKHSIRRYVYNKYTVTYLNIAEVEESLFGALPHHTTISHSIIEATIHERIYQSVKQACDKKIETSEVKSWNKIIDMVLHKGAGYNRDLLVGLITKYYRLYEK